MKKKYTNAPGWLGLNDDRTAFVFLDDRARIVQRIFDMSIAGIGGYTIAKLLNQQNPPAFGSSGRWDQSTIHNMLSSRATIGEYEKKEIIDGKEVPTGEILTDYYPAVVDLSTFNAAHAARKNNLLRRRGSKGKLLTNLLADLPRCAYCGSSVKLHHARPKSLVCKQVYDKTGCVRFKWTYSDFEQTLFKDLAEHRLIEAELDNLREAYRELQKQKIYQARLVVMQQLNQLVSSLSIAFAGDSLDQPNGRNARSNHSDRRYTLKLKNGTSFVGMPRLVEQRRSDSVDPGETAKVLRLSPRQGAIAALLAEGESLKLIAEKLNLSMTTARWHLREIFKRTSCHSQADLIDLIKMSGLSR